MDADEGFVDLQQGVEAVYEVISLSLWEWASGADIPVCQGARPKPPGKCETQDVRISGSNSGPLPPGEALADSNVCPTTQAYIVCKKPPERWGPSRY